MGDRLSILESLTAMREDLMHINEVNTKLCQAEKRLNDTKRSSEDPKPTIDSSESDAMTKALGKEGFAAKDAFYANCIKWLPMAVAVIGFCAVPEGGLWSILAAICLWIAGNFGIVGGVIGIALAVLIGWNAWINISLWLQIVVGALGLLYLAAIISQGVTRKKYFEKKRFIEQRRKHERQEWEKKRTAYIATLQQPHQNMQLQIDKTDDEIKRLRQQRLQLQKQIDENPFLDNELKTTKVVDFILSLLQGMDDSAADCKNTIFGDQSQMLAESTDEQFLLEYLRAAARLYDFCTNAVSGTFEYSENSVSCSHTDSGYHYHDGYAYETYHGISVTRITEEKYYKNIAGKLPPNENYDYISRKSSEAFLIKETGDLDSLDVCIYAKDFLGIDGFFIISRTYWTTM